MAYCKTASDAAGVSARAASSRLPRSQTVTTRRLATGGSPPFFCSPALKPKRASHVEPLQVASDTPASSLGSNPDVDADAIKQTQNGFKRNGNGNAMREEGQQQQQPSANGSSPTAGQRGGIDMEFSKWATSLVDASPVLRNSLSLPMMAAVNGYWLSQCIYVATRLGIPDVLAKSDRAMTIREIADKVGAHPPALYRLMRSLSGQGPFPGLFIEVFPIPDVRDLPFPLNQAAGILPFVKGAAPAPIARMVPTEIPFRPPFGLWRSTDEDAESPMEADLERRYALTPLGAVLRADMEGGIHDVTLMQGSEMYQAWGRLEEAVRTGETAFDTAFGSGLWEWYEERPDRAQTFDRSMSNLTTLHLAPGSAGAEFDFSYDGSASTICDIGGGQGRLLCKALERYPEMTGILFDQQAVMDKVSQGGFMYDTGLLSEGRVSLVPGSFFEPEAIPKGCDVYTMKHIIHDWDDDASVTILSNIVTAMKPGSRLLLLEVVVPEDNAYNPFSTEFSSYFDLHMFVAVGGAERRPSEFRSILERAGLKLANIHKGTGPGSAMCVVEAVLA